MAKQRIVNTRFWDDSYVVRMSTNEKLVFLYLLTNPLTTIAGAYELSLKRASFDVGLPIREITNVFEKLEADGKLIRHGDWIGIVNFIKHQSLNPKVKRGIQIELENAPQALVEQLNVDIESLSQPKDRLSHSNINLNSNSIFNLKTKASTEGALDTVYPQDLQKERQQLIKKMRLRN